MMALTVIQPKCRKCDKTVYLVDQLRADGIVYHKACFRCHHCQGTIKLGNYASLGGTLYCKPHFDQLFKLTGSFDKSFDEPGIIKKSTSERFQALDVGEQSIFKRDKPIVYRNTRKMCSLWQDCLPH